MADLKKRIKELRMIRKLSHSQVAANFGKTEGAIRSWETGRTKPDAEMIIKLSQYFEVSTDYLLGLTDIKSADVDIKEICEYTGLSEEVVNMLTTLNKEKKIYSENEASIMYQIDSINKLLETLNYYPDVLLVMIRIAEIDTKDNGSYEIQKEIMDSHMEIYNKIYENGTILKGRQYRDYLEQRLETDVYLWLKMLISVTSPFPTETDEMSIKEYKRRRSSGASTLKSIAEDNIEYFNDCNKKG